MNMQPKEEPKCHTLQEWLELTENLGSYSRFKLLPPRLPVEQRRVVALAYCWSSDSSVRERALDLLIDSCEESDLSIFMRFSRAPEMAIRCTAAAGLGNFDSPEANDRLLAMVHKDRNSCVRRYALHAIRERDFPDGSAAVPLAKEVLAKREHASVLLEALAILQVYGVGPGISALERLPNYSRPPKWEQYTLDTYLRPTILSHIRSQRAQLAFLRRSGKLEESNS